MLSLAHPAPLAAEPAIAGAPALAALQDPPARTAARVEPVMGTSAPDTESEPDTAPPESGEPPKRRWGPVKRTLLVLVLVGTAGASAFIVYETRTSTLQAKVFSEMAGKLSFRMEKGPSKAIRFPASSPYDDRLGYSNIPN